MEEIKVKLEKLHAHLEAIKKQGIKYNVIVDLDKLTEYCNLHGIKDDEITPSRFVQAK